MSGTGTPDFSAPTRLTTISGDQPIGTTVDGVLVMPSMYFVQTVQRLLSYIGQPATGGTGSGSGITLTEQVSIATDIAIIALQQSTGGGGGVALTLQNSISSGASSLGSIPAAPAPSPAMLCAMIDFGF
jgi:hypothetical protein